MALDNHLSVDSRLLSDISEANLEECFEGKRRLMPRGPTFSVLILTHLSAFTLKPNVYYGCYGPLLLWAHLATLDLWGRSGLWSDSGIHNLMSQSKEEIYGKMELALCGGSL